jgi:anti-sigma B factor antagonist
LPAVSVGSGGRFAAVSRRTPVADVLGITLENEGDQTVCRIRGDLDAVSAPRLRAVLAERINSDVVLELSELQFIDSSGLGVLVGALKRFEAAGRRLTLRAPTSGIQRVFAITGLDRAFSIEG